MLNNKSSNDSNAVAYLGAIEAGGTKFVCAIATIDGEILNETRFPTTEPEVTLQRAIDFFKKNLPSNTESELKSIGIGTFGPVGVNPDLDNYGKILATPKEGWENTDMIAPFISAFPGVKVKVDTDVNAAALGEGKSGVAKNLSSYVYITIGTGIGGGVVINDEIIKGHSHPEIGHLTVLREEGDTFAGVCPFHSDCIEGLASGESIHQRWGVKAECLPPGHVAWQLEASYIASLCQTLTSVLSPQRIILGGGIMEQSHLLPLIHQKFEEKAGGYWSLPSNYIVTPALGNQSGIVGAVDLALNA